MSFSTKGIDTTTKANGPSKSLGLGNHTVKLYSVEMVEASYENSNGGRRDATLVLTLVGKPEGAEFEGWPIDKDNPSKGNHQGPVARVNISQYNFGDKLLANDIRIDRDTEIVKHIAMLADELNVRDVIDEISAATIEDYVKAANQALRSSKSKLNVLIGGRQYLSQEGKIRYNYYLPKIRNSKSFQNSEADVNMVPVFSEAEHVYIPEKVRQALTSAPQVSQAATKPADSLDDIDW